MSTRRTGKRATVVTRPAMTMATCTGVCVCLFVCVYVCLISREVTVCSFSGFHNK
jgi:hypothetical protein